MYEGHWNNNVPQGRGIYTWGDSRTVYVGEFLNGKKHGNGLLKYKAGIEFMVYYLEDSLIRHGEAFLTQEDVSYVPDVPPMPTQFKKPKPKKQFFKVEYIKL